MDVMTNSQFNVLREAIVATWGYVAADCDDMDNDEAIEVTIDANRMATMGYEAADFLIMKLVKENGYLPVLKYLSKKISLV